MNSARLAEKSVALLCCEKLHKIGIVIQNICANIYNLFLREISIDLWIDLSMDQSR